MTTSKYFSSLVLKTSSKHSTAPLPTTHYAHFKETLLVIRTSFLLTLSLYSTALRPSFKQPFSPHSHQSRQPLHPPLSSLSYSSSACRSILINPLPPFILRADQYVLRWTGKPGRWERGLGGAVCPALLPLVMPTCIGNKIRSCSADEAACNKYVLKRSCFQTVIRFLEQVAKGILTCFQCAG